MMASVERAKVMYVAAHQIKQGVWLAVVLEERRGKMKESERLTKRRVSGMKSGYWTSHKKEELVERLAAYEDTGLSPEELAISMKSRRSAGIREIPTIKTDAEFTQYLDNLKAMVAEWKNDGLGYISVKCQLSDILCGLEDKDEVLTAGQLKQIFDLAK